ncbi:hypothetical protein [Silvibacterium sp.]|uniref:hypothetical protein n=1 Tax=Silvibacterium sp. TaxID=1964179 RepID=UPI0039E27A7B
MEDLAAAIEHAGLPPETLVRIQAELRREPDTVPNFEAAHVSYYLGALLIIGAMGWFVTSSWDTLSGQMLSAIALAYGALFGCTGWLLFQRNATKIPGGLLVAVAVSMTPLAIYGIERAVGWWPVSDPGGYSNFHPYINGSWIAMEISTVVVALTALWFVRFPFVAAPAAYALWYLSMDASAYLFHANWSFHQECMISTAFGIGMLICGYLLDSLSELDFAFWFYLFGLLAFTGGLSLMGSGSQLGRAVYCLIHLLMIAVSIILQRRAFLVFGALGVFAFLVSEAEGYFHDSFGFTIALTVIGALFIALGILFKRNSEAIEGRLAPLAPEHIRRRREAHRSLRLQP